MGSISVLIVDDNASLCRAVELMLKSESDMEVLGFATTTRDALSRAASEHPGIVLLDVNMPPETTFDTAQCLVNLPQPPQVLMVSGNDDLEVIKQSLSHGARGFVLKHRSLTRLPIAIRHVASGQSYFCPMAMRILRTVPNYLIG